MKVHLTNAKGIIISQFLLVTELYSLIYPGIQWRSELCYGCLDITEPQGVRRLHGSL